MHKNVLFQSFIHNFHNLLTALGLDKGVTNQLAAWELVDRILSSGMHVARVKSPNLFRLFYPKSRDLNESTDV